MEKVWLSYRSCACSCPRDDSWKKGVQEFYDGCKNATRSFRGKAFEVADATVNSLEQFITKLIDFANSNSSILQSSSTDILKTMSKNNNLNRSSMNIVIQFEKVFSIQIKEFNEIAKKLSDHIGELTCTFTDAVTEFGTELSKFMKKFLQSCRLFDCKKRVDFKCVLKKYQKLTNIVARIDDTLLNECGENPSQEVYDSILVFHLIYFYMGLSVTGVNSCVLDLLYDHKCYVSERVKSCTLSIEYGLVEIRQAVSAVVLTSIKSIKDMLQIFVVIAAAQNAVVEKVFGLNDTVLISVEEIIQSLVKGGKGTAPAA